VPSAAALPLQLSVTALTGEGNVFASVDTARPDAVTSQWSMGRSANQFSIRAIPNRVRVGAECGSDDFKFGDAGEIATVEACAALCANRAGCKYFIFGTGSKAGACYAEMTSSRECTEGWEDDEFDFYELPEPEWATADGSGHLVISPDACAELPCNVAIEVKGAAAGSTASSCSLLVKRWAGDAATGGGGGGLVVLILMLLGCGVYGVLVWQGKRSAQSDWAAARDMVDVAKKQDHRNAPEERAPAHRAGVREHHGSIECPLEAGRRRRAHTRLNRQAEASSCSHPSCG